jgi:hypothetical protein
MKFLEYGFGRHRVHALLHLNPGLFDKRMTAATGAPFTTCWTTPLRRKFAFRLFVDFVSVFLFLLLVALFPALIPVFLAALVSHG